MKTDYPAQIADRLRLAREELGLTLEQAAQETGFNNYQTVSSIGWVDAEDVRLAWRMARENPNSTRPDRGWPM